jgi:hypothetical protein
MMIEDLQPAPDHRTRFEWRHCASVPELAGCYVLATYAGVVLYVGLASRSIRDRMLAHFDNPVKQAGSTAGVPYWFLYLTCDSSRVNMLERGWFNIAKLRDGAFPPLNRVDSPVS